MIKQHYTPSDTPPQTLLSVDNFTSVGSKLPDFDASDGRYLVSYFQNEHGEQWIFVGDRIEKKATFWGGDIGWDDIDGIKIEITAQTKSIDVMLNIPEHLWIKACLATIGLNMPERSPLQDYLRKK